MNALKNFVLDAYEKIASASRARRVKAALGSGILRVGSHSYGIGHIDLQQYAGSHATVTIGKFCSIAPDVTFITGGVHPKEWVSLFPFRIKWGLPGAYTDGMPRTNGPISIGNDVWLATGVTITSGVTIGDGAIVAAGSLVTRDLPPYSISSGLPARVRAYRFDDRVIQALLDVKWWDWPEEKILEHVSLLSSPNVHEFLRRLER